MSRNPFATRRIRLISETQRETAKRAIDQAPDGFECVIQRVKSKRSLAANALYWKWIDCIRLHVMDTTGQAYSADAMHEFFKAKFLPTVTVEIMGEVQRGRLSTASLNTADMSEYMEKIDRYCADSLHLFLPSPNVPEE